MKAAKMPLGDLNTLINSTSQNLSQFKAFAAIDHLLLGGVPNIGGFTTKIQTNNDQNFGAKTATDPGPVFNIENIFINIANSLFQGNPSAQTAFNNLAAGITLSDKLTSIYNALVDSSQQSDAGRASFVAQADFYKARALELGIAGDTGGAVVGFGALLNILVKDKNIGIGDSVNDLIMAVADGSAGLPETSTTFIPIETADGTNFDSDDASTGSTGSVNLPSGVTSVLTNTTSETFTITDNLSTRIDVSTAIENVNIVFTEGSSKSVIDPGSFYGSFVNVVASGQGSFKGNDAFIFATRTDIYSSNLKSFDASGLKGRADVDFISDKGVTVTGSNFADDFDFFSPTGGSVENGDNRIIFNSANKSTSSAKDNYSDFFQGGSGDKVDITAFAISTGKTAITTFVSEPTGGENFNGNAVGVTGESQNFTYYVDTNSNGIFDLSTDLVFRMQDTTVMSTDNFLF